MFTAAYHQRAIDRAVDSRGRVVTIQVNDGTAFTDYPSRAKFGRLRDEELVNGSTLRQSDIRLIFSSRDWPPGVPDILERNDRVVFDGRSYAVVHCDPYRRMIGEQRIGIEVTVRG